MYTEGIGVPRDDVEAARWHRLAAEQGHARGQYHIGYSYANGEGVPRNYGEAVRWYLLAAEQGHANAQSNLGYMYAQGFGVPRDYVLAYMWFNLAAANGVDSAAGQREYTAGFMSAAQIGEAQRLAREWFAAHPN